jgi:hypothetical protein
MRSAPPLDGVGGREGADSFYREAAACNSTTRGRGSKHFTPAPHGVGNAPLRKKSEASLLTSIPDVAEFGDSRDLLVALRDRIATLVDDPNLHPMDLNSLCFRVLEILRDLDNLDRQPLLRTAP